jgi:hypothetical protein
MIRWLSMAVLSLSLVACASGKCRQKKDEKTFVEQVENLPHFKTKEAKSIKPGDLDTVKIYKADGTRQCEPTRPIPATELKTQLETNGVKVLKIEHTTDGVMHIQVCGSETGKIYVFDIQRLHLQKALKMGYKSLKSLEP